MNLTDGKSHQVALYMVDWDNMGRSQTVQVADAISGTVKDRGTVSNFYGGQWLLWNLSGHVKITLTRTAGVNAVASGLMFDPSTSAVVSASTVINGVVTAATVGGQYLVSVTAQDSQGDTATASGSVDTQLDAALPALSASAQAEGGTNIALNALWSDGSNLPNINYTWTITNTSTGQPVTTLPASNGTSGAKELSVTLPAAGTYNVSLTAATGGGPGYNASTSVTVSGAPTDHLVVTPTTAKVVVGTGTGTTAYFMVQEYDSNNVLVTTPAPSFQ